MIKIHSYLCILFDIKIKNFEIREYMIKGREKVLYINPKYTNIYNYLKK